MATFRVKKDKDNPYVIINRYGIYDENLSWKAKGLLMYFLSRPDDWSFYEDEIVGHAPDGKDSVRSGIKELIDKSYIVRETKRCDKGKFAGYEYTIYETPVKKTSPISGKPISDNPKTDIPTLEKPILDNPKVLNIDNTKYRNTLNIDSTKEQQHLESGVGGGVNNIEIYKFYESAGMGLVNQIITEKIDAAIEIYSKEWVKEAIEVAVTNNKYKLSYVEGILQNWKANGKDNKMKNTECKNKYNKKTSNWELEGSTYAANNDISELEKKLLGWDNE